MQDLARGFVHLFLPKICPGCREHVPVKNSTMCMYCLANLPFTDFHLFRENHFTEHFWGRVPIQSGTAMLYFIKGGLTQHLIHDVKYNGNRELGRELGVLFGQKLKESPLYQDLDMIIPVPLHPKKMKLRGFNQSAVFASGLAKVLDIPVAEDVLFRGQYTESQTDKSRMERVENVRHAFQLQDTHTLQGKHALLVDDVMTTGATLEACGLEILRSPGCRLSMATMAIGEI